MIKQNFLLRSLVRLIKANWKSVAPGRDLDKEAKWQLH